MAGRVVIVTGAGSGLGFHVAKTLSDGGSEVVLAGRDDEEVKAAVEKIKQLKPEAAVSSIQLDLSSIQSVHKFVEEFRATGKKLNALVTCDGIKLSNSTRSRRYSSDNFELTMAINHLGHFLLTNQLLPELKNAVADGNDARVVIVTSAMHDIKTSKQCKNLQPLDLDNIFLFNEKTFSSLQAYKNSRAANLLFAYELAKKVQESGIKVNAICPGVEAAEETAANGNGMQKMFAQVFMQCITAPTPSFDRCAVDICSLVTEEKYKDTTGKYIKDGAEISSSEETLNDELQAKLWDLSARYARLDGYEPLEVVPPPAEEEPTKKKEEKPKKKGKKDKAEDENGEEKVEIPEGQVNEDEVKENGTNGHHDATEENGKEELNGKNGENGTAHANGTEHTNGTSHTNGEEHANGKEEETCESDEAQVPTTIPEKCKVVEQSIESKPEDSISPVVEIQAAPAVDSEEAADR